MGKLLSIEFDVGLFFNSYLFLLLLLLLLVMIIRVFGIIRDYFWFLGEVRYIFVEYKFEFYVENEVVENKERTEKRNYYLF